MREESGGIAADRVKPEKGGACKCWVCRGQWIEIHKVNRVSVSVLDNWGNGGPDFTRTIPFDKLTAVMSRAAYEAYKRGELADALPLLPRVRQEQNPNGFDALRTALRSGVQVVSAAQLFPTPPDLADRVIELAGIRAGHTIPRVVIHPGPHGQNRGADGPVDTALDMQN